jgi:hypothetical protein
MRCEHGEPHRNVIVRKQKNSEKNLSRCNFVYNKSHKGLSDMNPGLSVEAPATKPLSHVKDFISLIIRNSPEPAKAVHILGSVSSKREC